MVGRNKAVFLDRDGVINKDVGYLKSFKNFIFLKDVSKAIKFLNNKNYLVIIIIVSKYSRVMRKFKKKKLLFNYNYQSTRSRKRSY